MWLYWLMFLWPAAQASQETATVRGAVSKPVGAAQQVAMPAAWWLTVVALALLVGLRHEVGGDWYNYLRNFEDAEIESQYAEWWANDPGYRMLEWLCIRLDIGIHGVNLMAGTVFSYGLVVFCRNLIRPWLAMTVAVPYLVIILGMGYSRQGMALGCLMAGLVGLGQGRLAKFVIWTVFGATFHKSAVLLLPLAALAASRSRMYTILWVGVVLAGSYLVLLEDSVKAMQSNYLDAEFESEGALVRLTMNALPAALLLWNRHRFALSVQQERLWVALALASLALLGLFFVSPSSTALDRVGLYLLPLQLMVFSQLPQVLGRQAGYGYNHWVLAVVAYYSLVQFVWLNYATHAFAWLPYRWYPLEVLFN